jgi:hypothetical protein
MIREMTEVKNLIRRRSGRRAAALAFSHDAATGRDDLLVSERLAAAVEIVDAWPAMAIAGRRPGRPRRLGKIASRQDLAGA